VKSYPTAVTSESILPDWQGVGDVLNRATFVADSCAYLHLFRLIGTARRDLTAAFQSISARLWVPSMVMNQVLETSSSISAAIMREAQENADFVAERVGEVDLLTRRAINRTNPNDIELRSRLGDFVQTGRALEESLLRAGRAQPKPVEELAAEHAAVSGLIKSLTADKIGPEPSDAQIERWTSDSRMRLLKGMAPTHSERKRKEPHRHADCIIWHQMVEYASSRRDIDAIAFVTRDTKPEGWVEYDNGSRLGAHRDLVREMNTAADTQFIVLGTADLIAYTESAAVEVLWDHETARDFDHAEAGPLRPIPSYFH
jgi:hypothetical protein